MAANNYRGEDTPAGVSGFVGMDSDLIGTGASSTQTRPASTHLHNRVIGNLMSLAAGMDQVSWCPISANSLLDEATGDRPWAALDWISIGLWHVPIVRGLTGVRINAVYNVQSQGTTQADCLMRIELGTASKTIALPNTDNGGSPDYDVISTTLSVGEVDLPVEVEEDALQYLPLRIWMRSLDGGARAGTDTVDGRGFFVDGATAPFFTESAGGNPDADSLEVQYLKINAGAMFADQAFEMLGRVNAASGQGMAIFPDGLVSGSLTVQRNYMSYLQLRGIWVQPLYTPESIIEVVQSDIETEKTVSGPVTSAILDGIRRIYERPRTVGYGPRGVLDPTHEEYQGLGYPERWPFVEGDAAAKVLIEESYALDADNPVLEIALNVIVVHHRQNRLPLIADDFGLAQRLDGSAEWTLELLLDQREDVVSAAGPTTWATDNTNVLSAAVSVDRKLPLYPASHFAKQPFLRQMAQAESFDLTTSLAFSYKEGSLFEADIPLVSTVTLAGRMTSFVGAATVRSVRLRVRVVRKAGSTPVFTSSQFSSNEFLRFVIVGFTVIQRAVMT